MLMLFLCYCFLFYWNGQWRGVQWNINALLFSKSDSGISLRLASKSTTLEDSSSTDLTQLDLALLEVQAQVPIREEFFETDLTLANSRLNATQDTITDSLVPAVRASLTPGEGNVVDNSQFAQLKILIGKVMGRVLLASVFERQIAESRQAKAESQTVADAIW
jgi:hypothetical protein